MEDEFIPQDNPTFYQQEEPDIVDEEEEFWEGDDEDWEGFDDEEEQIPPELMGIQMPSSIGSVKLAELDLIDLQKEEMELRIGQANDCLEKLRTNLGTKAMLYRQNFHSSNSTRDGTRTQKEIQKAVLWINKQVRSYHRARQAILRLDPDVSIRQKYQEIHPEDLGVNKEVTEENRFGQGTSKLAWFWLMGGEKNDGNIESGSPWMDECK